MATSAGVVATGRAVLLACSLVAACDSSDDGIGPPRTTITSPGTGEPIHDLFPLHAGTSTANTIILDPVEIEGVTVYPRGQLIPQAPEWDLLQRLPDGVYLAGNFGHGMFRHPLLVVPEPAFDGMAWDSDPGGGLPVRHCTVSAAAGVEIACTDGVLRLWVVNLVPGVGPVPGGGVLALDDAPVPPSLPPIAVRPINGGKPIFADFKPSEVAGFLGIADDRGGLRIRTTGVVVARAPMLLDTGFVPLGGPLRTIGCARFDGHGFTKLLDVEEHVLFATDCPDPFNAAITADGQIQTALPGEHGGPYPVLARMPPAGGPPQVLAGSFAINVFRAPAVFPIDQTGLGISHLDMIGAVFLGAPLAFPVSHVLTTPDGGGNFGILTSDTGNGLTSTGGILSGGYVVPDGFVPARPALQPLGLSELISTNETRVLHTTPDGRIERVLLGPGGTKLAPLGRAQLPATHRLMGALEYQGKLLLFTHAGDLGQEAQERDGMVNEDILPAFGGLYAWTAAIPPDGEPAVPSPTRGGVVAGRVGRDTRVCWPGDAPAITSGWMFGPYPAQAVPSGPGCVLVLRDLRIVDAEVWDVVGPIPGLGRVRMLDVSAQWPTLANRDEFNRSETYLTVNGGVCVAGYRPPADASSIHDVTGATWAIGGCNAHSCNQAWLIDDHGRMRLVPQPPVIGLYPTNPNVALGGLIDDDRWLTLDLQYVAHPAPPPAAKATRLAMLADHTLCGVLYTTPDGGQTFTPDRIYCQPPTGAVRTIAYDPAVGFALGPDGGLWSDYARFDPLTMAIRRFTTAELTNGAVIPDSDVERQLTITGGHIYVASFRQRTEFHFIHRFDAGTWTDIPVPHDLNFAIAGVTLPVIDGDLATFPVANGRSFRLSLLP